MTLHIRIDLSGIVAHGPLEITDKLNECKYFINLMKQNTNWDEFRWLTSAFLNGARSALDWLAYAVYNSRIDEEGEFYPNESARDKLNKYIYIKQEIKTKKVYATPKNRLLKDLCEHRKITAHQDSLHIKPEEVSKPTDFIFVKDGKNVIDFSEKVLSLLYSIQDEVR